MMEHDVFRLDSDELGDLTLRSKVFPDAEGIVTSSCDGPFTENIYFGKAGVGKSTVASLVSSKTGLFDSGNTGSGTTTLG